MADIQNSDNHRKPPGPIRAKKASTRIDFTPMVDLGFLLITFFMLTTTLARPQIMALVMPDKAPDKAEIQDSKVLTLLLGAQNKVYWYEGIVHPELDSTDYSADGLRRVILDKMERVDAKWGQEHYEDSRSKTAKDGSLLTVLIKPTRNARYQNLVDALDEMAVCRVRYYMILDVSEQEEAFIHNPIAGMVFTPEQQKKAVY